MKRQNVHLLVSSLVCVTASIAFFLSSHSIEELEKFPSQFFWKTATHELGVAFLVAFVLNVSIEALHRHRHAEEVEEVSLSVFKAVLKRSLPDKVVHEYERSVVDSTAYRENGKLFYELVRASDGAGIAYAKLTARNLHDLVNATKRKIKQNCYAHIEVPPFFADKCRIEWVKINGKELAPQELRSCIEVTKNGCSILFSKEIAIEAGSRVSVETKYVLAQRLEWTEIVCSVLPTTDLAVEVSVPNADFHVTASSIHPLDAVEDAGHDGVRKFAWKLPFAALPGHGMCFEWYPVGADQKAANGDAAIPQLAANG